MYSCTLCTCQCKFGTRVTFPLVVAVSSSAVLDDLGALRGGSPDGSLGLSVGHTRLRGGAPLGSLGLSCPDSLSEGLPVIPHGHCVLGSSARPLGLPASSRSLSSPPRSGRYVFGSSECALGLLASSLPLSSSPQSGGVSSSTLAAFVACASMLPRASGSCSACSGARGFALSVFLPPPHLLFSAHPPMQCPSFGEHNAHFVGSLMI